MHERTHVGLDVHALTVVACAIDGQTGEIFRDRLTPDHGEILAWIKALPGPSRVVYEAGPTGFVLARALRAAGIDCVVAAPSKLQRPSGDRVKTDKNDALHLARLLKLDQITEVTIPSPGQEAARDLVRAREDTRGGPDARPTPGLQTPAAPRSALQRRHLDPNPHGLALSTAFRLPSPATDL